MTDEVDAIAIDGHGAVFAAGRFTYVCGDITCASIGNTTVNNIARFDGAAWSALGTGMDNSVLAIALSGSNLYAGGDFNLAGTCSSACSRIAKWNGKGWSALGTGMDNSVLAIALSGSYVYAGGPFTTAGGCTGGCSFIARFDGEHWSKMGTALGSTQPNGEVYAIAISGSDVYAGGSFTAAGTCTVGCSSIAKWNGATWSPLRMGMNSPVDAIALSGSDVYAGGNFIDACGDEACGSGNTTVNHIARLSGFRQFLPLVVR